MKTICRIILLVNILLTQVFSYSEAGNIPSGYEKVNWNFDVESVMAKYPRGQLGRLADGMIYRQFKPNQQIARRNFAFKDGKLHTVSLTFDKQYVEKSGIEKLVLEYTKRYGEGGVDSTQAPHMISHFWQNGNTKITFAYAPRRPDMTVIIYEMYLLPSTPLVKNP